MSGDLPRADRGLIGVLVLCVAGLAAALFTQYRFDMQPCPWCVLQRAILAAIAIACVIGLVWRQTLGRRVGAGLGTALALCGVAAALWQHFVAAASASCKLTLADKIVSRWLQLDQLLPDVFEARASCADAKTTLLGLPYDFWSLGLFVVIAILLARLLSARASRR